MVTIHKLPIKDAYIVKTKTFTDERGYVWELYDHRLYPEEVEKFFPVKQVTVSSNKKYAVRGLVAVHFAKLLSCASGAIYDVVVDLRKSSPTYLNWCAVLLTQKNGKQLLVPPGCAQGYVAVEDGSTMVYCQGDTFSSITNETRLHALDKTINIYWPVSNDDQLILTKRDKSNPGVEVAGIMEKRKRVLIIWASSSDVGPDLLEYLRAYRSSLHVYGASNKPAIDGVMDFDLNQAAEDESYIEEILTVCRPNCLVFALPWGPKIQGAVKGFCEINKEFKMKMVLCCDKTWFAGNQIKAKEVTVNVLAESGGTVLQIPEESGKWKKVGIIDVLQRTTF